MNTDDMTTRKRLEVLELAQQLGNASEACRRTGVDRTSFYKWQRRFARDGIDGLKRRAHIAKPHPQTTAADIARKIISFGLAHPSYGCNRIGQELGRQRIELSAVTVQKILHKAGVGTRERRGAALELVLAEGKKLSPEQIDFLEDFNPCLRERAARPAGPGELLYVGSFFLGRFAGLGTIHVHAIVDAFSAYALAQLGTGKEAMTATLIDSALPFLSDRGLRAHAIVTGKVGIAGLVQLRDSVMGSGIEVRESNGDGAPGFVERLRRRLLDEFFRRPCLRRSTPMDLPRLRREFASWLIQYNQQPMPGYPAYGVSPQHKLGKGGRK